MMDLPAPTDLDYQEAVMKSNLKRFLFFQAI